MKLLEVAVTTGGTIVTSDANADKKVDYAFASDLMSDVLTTSVDNLLLITGLSNLQTIRTAEMSDIYGILLVRGRSASDEMRALASELGIVIIETGYSMFRSCGLLYNSGLKPLF